MKLKILIFSLLIFIACENNTERRKIRLADESVNTKFDQQLTTTIHLDQTKRLSIAVMFFKNQTGDENLQWLQQGLTEMLIRALSQSRSLSVLSTDRLFEILERLSSSSSQKNIDIAMAAIVAQEANVEAVLTGDIIKSGDSLKINVKVHEPKNGLILREESVEGPGLETIFSMVDNLTQKIKNDLQLTLDKKAEPVKGIAELSTNSLEAWRYYMSGVELANKILHGQAIKQFEQAIAIDSTFVSAHLKLYWMYLSQGAVFKADKIFIKLQSLKSKASQKELYQLGILEASTKGDIRSIISINQQWIQQFPDDRDAYLNMASFYFKTHNYDKAIPYYEKMLTIDPKYKLALNQLGYIYAYVGDFTNAISNLKKYQQIAPDESNPFDSLGEIYLFLGKYKQAEKQFNQALKVDKNFTPSLKNLGCLNLDRGDYANALKAFKKYLKKQQPNFIQSKAYSNIALTYWRLGEKDNAIANYQRSLQNSVFSFPVVEYMQEIYLEDNDSTQAQQVIAQNYEFTKKSIESGNKRINLLLNLFMLSFWNNYNIDETITILNEVIKDGDKQTDKLQLKFLLTILYIKNNKHEELKKLSGELPAAELMAILKEIRHISYNGIWKYYSFINQAFYNSLDQGIDNYNKLIELSLKNNSKMSEMIFRLFLTDLYFYAGDLENARQQLKIVGMAEESAWMVIGPFDNKNGFQKKFPPEKKISLNKTYRQKDVTVKWQRHTDKMNEGFVNFKQIYAKSNWSVAYGLIYISSPANKKVQFRIGSNEAVKLWLNDKEIWKFNESREAIFDDDLLNVTLKQGINKVMIKVCNRLGDWGFYFRVTDEEGNGVPDIKFVLPQHQT